jgi:hypothetical protein
MADVQFGRRDPVLESLYREALVQQDKSGNAPQDTPPGDVSPDSEDRIRDFMDRHGGPGSPRRQATEPAGDRGWYEIYAADGYRLRCDWSRLGGREELKFSEIGPQKTEGGSGSPA